MTQTPKFRAFPSIGDYASTVKNARDTAKWNNSAIPTLTFKGSVKLHGTNAAISFAHGDQIGYQSRERNITYESDNAGFATWAMALKDKFMVAYAALSLSFPGYDACYVYGEWCGGSIQKGVALNQLEKKFGVFEIVFANYKTDEEIASELAILVAKGNENTPCIFKDQHTVRDIKKYHELFKSVSNNIVVIDEIVKPIMLEIDFNRPEEYQNALLDATMDIEKICPFGKAFGVEGTGEGLVWTCLEKPTIKFKTKGAAHVGGYKNSICGLFLVDKDFARLEQILIMNKIKEFTYEFV